MMVHAIENTGRCNPKPYGGATVAIDDEGERFVAAGHYENFDAGPGIAFDRISELAADLFDAPISIIGIVERDRIWFKSHHGLNATEVGRSPEGCESAMLSIESWILTNAKVSQPCANTRRENRSLRFCVGAPLRASDGHILGALSVLGDKPRRVDPQQLRHLEALASIVMDEMELHRSTRRAAAQAAITTREVDHRVMNSLQFVASLLSMQSRVVSTPEAADQLTIAAKRVLAVARVHRHFVADETSDGVEILTYLRELCGELSDALQAEIQLVGVAASLPRKQILAIGLIVNELVTNAKKHGAGLIKVKFARDGADMCEICVADEGEGLPEGFTPDRGCGGLGMKLVTVLVDQLEGRLSASPNPAGRGACFIVTFPAPSAAPAFDSEY